jgi:hypothetical protein
LELGGLVHSGAAITVAVGNGGLIAAAEVAAAYRRVLLDS